MWGSLKYPLSEADAAEIIGHPDRREDETPLTSMMRWAGMDRNELPANFDHRLIHKLCKRQDLIEDLREFAEEEGREDLLERLQEVFP